MSDSVFWDRSFTQDPRHTEVPDRVLGAELVGLKPGHALDLGCGAGVNAIKLASRGWQVVGVDFSPRAVALARTAAADHGAKVTFEVADATEWEPPRAFDLVVSTFALPGAAATEKLLRVAAAALAPGGTLVVAEWDASMVDEWGPEAGEFLGPRQIAELLPGLTIRKAEVRHVSALFESGDPRGNPQTVAAIAVVRAQAQGAPATPSRGGSQGPSLRRTPRPSHEHQQHMQ